MLQTWEICHYGPVCDVSETGLYGIMSVVFPWDVVVESHKKTQVPRIHISYHSIPECHNLFSGVKLSIRSFCFIILKLSCAIKESSELEDLYEATYTKTC